MNNRGLAQYSKVPFKLEQSCRCAQRKPQFQAAVCVQDVFLSCIFCRHSSSEQLRFVSKGPYRCRWLWSRLRNAPHSAKLKQLQREGRTSSRPPYPKFGSPLPVPPWWLIRGCLRLPDAPTALPRGLRNSPASPAAFKTETCLLCTRCSVPVFSLLPFLFQRVPPHSCAPGKKKTKQNQKRASKQVFPPLKINQNILKSSPLSSVHPSLTHGACVTGRRCSACVRQRAGYCAPGGDGALPSVINSSSGPAPLCCVMLVERRRTWGDKHTKRFGRQRQIYLCIFLYSPCPGILSVPCLTSSVCVIWKDVEGWGVFGALGAAAAVVQVFASRQKMFRPQGALFASV